MRRQQHEVNHEVHEVELERVQDAITQVAVATAALQSVPETSHDFSEPSAPSVDEAAARQVALQRRRAAALARREAAARAKEEEDATRQAALKKLGGAQSWTQAHEPGKRDKWSGGSEGAARHQL